MTALIVYEGYALYEWGRKYKSQIDDKWVTFDTAAQWKKYIDLKQKRDERKRNRRN